MKLIMTPTTARRTQVAVKHKLLPNMMMTATHPMRLKQLLRQAVTSHSPPNVSSVWIPSATKIRVLTTLPANTHNNFIADVSCAGCSKASYNAHFVSQTLGSLL